MANFEFGRYGNRGVDVLGMALFQTLANLGKSAGMGIQESRRKEEAGSIVQKLLESKGFAPQGGKTMNANGTLNPMVPTPAEPFSMENIGSLGRLAEIAPQTFQALQGVYQMGQPKFMNVARGSDVVSVQNGKLTPVYENPSAMQPPAPIRSTQSEFKGGNGNWWTRTFNPVTQKTEMKDTGIPFPKEEKTGAVGKSKTEETKIKIQITSLTRRNQQLGQQMTDLDTSLAVQLSKIPPELQGAFSGQVNQQKKSLQKQIVSNELMLEDYNEQIGGTFKSVYGNVKRLLESSGKDASEESILKFLENNPDFQ